MNQTVRGGSFAHYMSYENVMMMDISCLFDICLFDIFAYITGNDNRAAFLINIKAELVSEREITKAALLNPPTPHPSSLVKLIFHYF